MTPNGLRVFEFDSPTGSGNMVYQWRGKLNLTPYPLTLTIAQVRALDFTNLLLRVYADGALLYTKVITSQKEFVIPALAQHDSYEWELLGTSTARNMQGAEDVQELG